VQNHQNEPNGFTHIVNCVVELKLPGSLRNRGVKLQRSTGLNLERTTLVSSYQEVQKIEHSRNPDSTVCILRHCFTYLFFAVRLYDTNTGQCFVPANPREYHTGPINMVSND